MTPRFEIVVVNDGSRDDTGAVLDTLAAGIPQLRPVQLRRNVGQHIATVVGLRARGAYVVTADADEQVPFANIAALYGALFADRKIDIVNGARSTRNAGLYRGLGSRLVTWIINRNMRQRLKDPATTFRLFRRTALEELLNVDALAQNIPILVGYLGLKIREVDVGAHAHGGRKSSYGFLKLVHALLLALLNFSSGTTTILTLMAAGFLSLGTGSVGLVAVVLHGSIAKEVLPTNWLLFFVLLVVLGLQFVLVGAVAYKIERLNVNLRFRQQLELIGHDRDC
ncbi:glycosyltransferase family 2 protein [Bradyrhizobium sp. TZ2]